jgi:hypothetical protein
MARSEVSVFFLVVKFFSVVTGVFFDDALRRQTVRRHSIAGDGESVGVGLCENVLDEKCVRV